jgi:hypothetical protein
MTRRRTGRTKDSKKGKMVKKFGVHDEHAYGLDISSPPC